MKRTRMKQRRATPRRRSAEHFVDDAYRAHLRRQPCVVCGSCNARLVEGGGWQGGNEAHHHADFHAGRGTFKGWTRYERATWQDEHAEVAWIGYAGSPEEKAGVF